MSKSSRLSPLKSLSKETRYKASLVLMKALMKNLEEKLEKAEQKLEDADNSLYNEVDRFNRLTKNTELPETRSMKSDEDEAEMKDEIYERESELISRMEKAKTKARQHRYEMEKLEKEILETNEKLKGIKATSSKQPVEK